jgi:hypothetical protein
VPFSTRMKVTPLKLNGLPVAGVSGPQARVAEHLKEKGQPPSPVRARSVAWRERSYGDEASGLMHAEALAKLQAKLEAVPNEAAF